MLDEFIEIMVFTLGWLICLPPITSPKKEKEKKKLEEGEEGEGRKNFFLKKL